MKISKLQKKIGQFTLQIEELYLESGKVHGLIGTNGCGKTTLSKLIPGYYDDNTETVSFA